jgi:DNA-directed RNA polymerase I subunit RPA1
MGKILMENVVEKVCHSCVVREIPGIKRCLKLPGKRDTDPTVASIKMLSNVQKLIAEGRNLKGLWDLGDIIDLNVLYSNDIGAIMDSYGVEAGRACIIKEITGIFGMCIPYKVILTLQVCN